MSRRPSWIAERKAIPAKVKAEAWEQADGRCQHCGITLDPSEAECWKPVKEYGMHYEVSCLGRVRSVSRVVPSHNGSRRIKSVVLKPLPHSGGYAQVSLSVNGSMYRRFIHRLVLEAFVGIASSGQVACHNNGIKTDNRLANLRWDTVKANMADKVAHGTQTRGENAVGAKLKESDVVEIKKRCAQGASQNSVGLAFGVSQGTVNDIVCGRTWKHL